MTGSDDNRSPEKVEKGRANPFFVCMGGCMLLTAVGVLVLSAIVAIFANTKLPGDEVAASPACKADAVLTSCNAETEKHPYYHDSNRRLCVVRWGLDPGCLKGINSFASAADCQARCMTTNSTATKQLPAECLEPVHSSECTDNDLVFREHSFFFQDGNCSRYTGAKCLYGPNRFTTVEQCEQACLVTGEPSCRVPRFLGACRSSQKRLSFYFDRSLSACVRWRTACLAGPNHHETLAACADACERDFFKRLASAF